MSTIATPLSEAMPQLQREVYELRERMNQLEREVAALVPHSPSDDVRQDTKSGDDEELERKALTMAEELFPGPVTIDDSIDPEYPDHKMRVITVSARGEVSDIATRSLAWHKRMISELGAAGAHITIFVSIADA